MLSFLDVLGRMCVDTNYFNLVSADKYLRKVDYLNNEDLLNFFQNKGTILSRFEMASIHIFLEKEAGLVGVPSGKIREFHKAWHDQNPKSFNSSHFYIAIGTCCVDSDYLTEAMKGNFLPLAIDNGDLTDLKNILAKVKTELEAIGKYWIPPDQLQPGGKCAPALTHSKKFKMPVHLL